MNISSMQRRWRNALGALLAGMLAVGVAAVPAQAAAPGDFPGGNTTGSLTVHKFQEAGNTNQFRPDGKNNDTSNLVPLDGAEFTVSLVQGLDLSKPQSWNILKRLQFTSDTTATDPGASGSQPKTYTLTKTATQTTANGGLAVFQALPAGAYAVKESKAPQNVTQTSAPFFVSIPFPYENSWLKNVHVYPKNSVSTMKKEAGTPDGLGLGSHLPWTATLQVPKLAAGKTFSEFVISDELDPRLKFTPQGDDSLQLDGQTVPANLYTLSAAGSNPVTVTFNAEGLKYLDQHQGGTITWKFTTQVVSNKGSGVIENRLKLRVNGNEITTPTPGTSKWGAVKIVKHAEGKEEKTLSGAVFEVYEKATGGTPISVTGDNNQPVTQFTTGDDGSVVIPGLFVGNGEATSRDYYLQEVQAPGGYAKLTDRVKVTVTTSGTDAPVQIKIANKTDEGSFLPNLPLTGGLGTTLLVVGGLAMLAVAGGAVLMRRRTAAHA